MTYYYPDIFDHITLSIIESKKLDVDFLMQAENTILSSAEKIFESDSFSSLLDLGCGAGRLTIKFSKYFDQVTALDPDQRRIGIAKINIEDNHIQNVSYVQAPFSAEKFPAKHFDVVLCNQIIQHIDTKRIEPMMQGIFKVLKSNGIFVLTTSYSNKDDDFFLKSFIDKGEVVSQTISEAAFNGLTTNDKGILPVHYFSPARLKKHLTQFHEIQFSPFDNLYPHSLLDTLLFIGQKSNKSP